MENVVAEAVRGTRYVRVALTVLVIVTIDQITKSLAVAKLTRGKSVQVIGEFLQLDLVTNSGGSFSLLQGNTVLLALAAISVSGYLIYLIKTTEDSLTVIALVSLLSGATGNIVDRLFRQPGPLRGEVIDFIALPHWPTFNVADMAVSCGGVLLAYSILRVGWSQRRADDVSSDGRRPSD